MLFAPDTLTWQPYITRRGVAVFLDHSFADTCHAHPAEDQESVTRGVLNQLGYRDTAPGYTIDYKGGILPRGFYTNRDGLWLTLIEPSSDPVALLTYCGHNDDFPTQQLLLLHLFGAWANVAQTALDLKSE